jgi:Xaa-Pro aminopeptidase
MQEGDLLLLDVAAAIHGYNSDLTRTIPVSGKFSRRQKQVYNAVLRVFRQMRKAMTSGKTIFDLRKECEEVTAKECVDLGLLKPADLKKTGDDGPAVKKYFMRRLASHRTDVHDVLYPSQRIQPGWVLRASRQFT